jgi:hypothetical protein
VLTLCLPAWGQVAGVVVDVATGAPVAGALVTLQTTSVQTTTDGAGRFELADATGGPLIIVGARKGFYNGYVRLEEPAVDVTIGLEAVPQDDDPNYEFVDPMQCGECHPDQTDQWTGSAMARAGSNTWVYDIYDGSGTAGGEGGFVYLRDSAFAHDNPASECAACHQPEPWVAEPYQPLDPSFALSTGALHGISCEICHKIADVDESKPNYPGLYPGAVTLTRPSDISDQVQYGMLGDSSFDLNTQRMKPSYQPQLTAAMCGACHQDKNDPDEDGDFEEEDGVISEPSYLEWLDSPYSDPESPLYATCVDCHMPASGFTTAAGGWYGYRAPERDPETIRSHRIEGTTARYLDNAVSLEMFSHTVDDGLRVDVVITNDQAGHHVPDGVTVRNMILLVEARRRDDGQLLRQSAGPMIDELGGVGDPAQGYYAGLPGTLFAKVNHDAAGNGPTFFTDAVGIQWDNRIPALGVDESSYTFELPDDGAGVDVRARLIYRRAFRFLVDAKGWTEDGHGQPLEDVQPPHFGHLMEEATWSSSLVTAVTDEASTPGGFSLGQNYPNPFNPQTRIRYEVPESGRVVLVVFNMLGETVRRLVDEHQAAGTHALEWDGRDDAGRPLAAGTYLYRLQAAAGTEMRKMLLIR